MWTQLSPTVCVSLVVIESLTHLYCACLNCFKLLFLVPSWYGTTPGLREAGF